MPTAGFESWAAPATPPASQPLLPPVAPGDIVIRAINDDAPDDQRDIRALGMVHVHASQTIDAAIKLARAYMRAVPSKQWGDQAIAVLRDADQGYRLLQLDSVLAGFEGPPDHQTWWSVDAYRTVRPDIVAVLNGFEQQIEDRGAVTTSPRRTLWSAPAAATMYAVSRATSQ
ncbi:MAG: hypothetical protein JWN41_912 [Thermoleophilia bacterium]|nr:hypothetical protein [Thermoleophilia bacterium]